MYLGGGPHGGLFRPCQGRCACTRVCTVFRGKGPWQKFALGWWWSKGHRGCTACHGNCEESQVYMQVNRLIRPRAGGQSRTSECKAGRALAARLCSCRVVPEGRKVPGATGGRPGWPRGDVMVWPRYQATVRYLAKGGCPTGDGRQKAGHKCQIAGAQKSRRLRSCNVVRDFEAHRWYLPKSGSAL